MVPTKFRFSTGVGGRTSRFQFSFWVTACLNDLLGKTGVWDHHPDSNYDHWISTLGAIAGTNRGSSGIRQNASEDYVVDVCTGVRSATIGNDARKSHVISPPGTFKNLLSCEGITKEKSYAGYEIQTRLVVDHKKVFHSVSQLVEYGSSAIGTFLDDAMRTRSADVPNKSASDGQPVAADIEERQGTADQFVLLQGRAARLKFEPAIGELSKVGGHEVTEVARDQRVQPAGNFFGCPLWSAQWWVIYRIPKGYVEKLTAKPSPTICTNKGKDKEEV